MPPASPCSAPGARLVSRAAGSTAAWSPSAALSPPCWSSPRFDLAALPVDFLYCRSCCGPAFARARAVSRSRRRRSPLCPSSHVYGVGSFAVGRPTNRSCCSRLHRGDHLHRLADRRGRGAALAGEVRARSAQPDARAAGRERTAEVAEKNRLLEEKDRRIDAIWCRRAFPASILPRFPHL